MLSKKILNRLIRDAGLDFDETNEALMNPTPWDTEYWHQFVPDSIREHWDKLELDHKLMVYIVAKDQQLGL